jgi:hypothetical protein
MNIEGNPVTTVIRNGTIATADRTYKADFLLYAMVETVGVVWSTP